MPDMPVVRPSLASASSAPPCDSSATSTASSASSPFGDFRLRLRPCPSSSTCLPPGPPLTSMTGPLNQLFAPKPKGRNQYSSTKASSTPTATGAVVHVGLGVYGVRGWQAEDDAYEAHPQQGNDVERRAAGAQLKRSWFEGRGVQQFAGDGYAVADVQANSGDGGDGAEGKCVTHHGYAQAEGDKHHDPGG
eukprot:CAMPEP_0202917622 /NCGR_PEP_ID=MMETSP1392-20130828/71439_1 /ASSEMBLY_ACC=CAM_ASM_000868 /TAXON_ID=225041 /ORGANISM="Chlamydomonas chlamydogama, Strain SAG 11-48b" /LENGTH=190 /DNA_ID=CAMNT_0049610427 /DNA_START=356 /DNA_END=924 /DNA_ORIENTATION=+